MTLDCINWFMKSRDYNDIVSIVLTRSTAIVNVTMWNCLHNRPVAQIQQYTSPISYNAPVPHITMHHFETEMCPCVDISATKWGIRISVWCFEINVRWIYYSVTNDELGSDFTFKISLKCFTSHTYVWQNFNWSISNNTRDVVLVSKLATHYL